MAWRNGKLKAWEYLLEENNRSLLSWLSAGVLGTLTVGATIASFVSSPKDMSFELIKGGLVDMGEGLESSFEVAQQTICGESISEFRKIDFEGCPRASIFLISRTGPYVLDITAQNNTDRMIVVRSVSLDVELARQQWNPTGGEGAEIIRPTTTVVAESSQSVLARLTIEDCSEMEKTLLGIVAAEGTLFEITERVEVHDVVLLELPDVVAAPARETLVHDCLAEVPFSNGEFEISREQFAACEKALGQPCVFSVAEFEITSPFSFYGALADPIRVPPGDVVRLLIELQNFGSFPNNLLATITINDGAFRSDHVFLHRYHSGQIWQQWGEWQ